MKEHKTNGKPCWCNPKIVHVKKPLINSRRLNKLLDDFADLYHTSPANLSYSERLARLLKFLEKRLTR